MNSTESSTNDIENNVEKITIIHVLLNYPQYEPLSKNMITDSNVDEIIKLNRRNGKIYHQSRNENIATKLGFDKEAGFYASTYSPFITFKLNVTNESDITSRLEQYTRSDDIQAIFADVLSFSNTSNDMDTMFSDIGLDTYSTYSDYYGYDGTGVVIGILDYGGDCIFGTGGLVDINHTNFADVDIETRNEWYCNEKVSDHATLVASIAAGNTGIARKAKLLSVQTDALGYASEFDWMLDRDVNVVNMSFGDAGTSGNYSGNAAYLDYIVRNYWVSIVKSAGNTGSDITSPGTGYNVITVGALSNNSAIRTSSAWEENFIISKPNLVAPGTSISAGSAGPSSGTSFAAPHVTGTIALLMDRSLTLKAHPELIIAILQASADSSNLNSTYNDYDSSGLEEKVGAGMLRVDNAVDGAYRRSYTTLTNNDKYKTNIKEINVYLNSGDDFQASLVWLKNIIYLNGNPTPIASTDLDLRLFNPSGNLVASSNSTDYNQEFIRFTVNSDGYYTLKVYQYGTYENLSTEYIGIAYWKN